MDTIWRTDPITECGLVVLFPDDDASMWSNEVNDLVSAVEDRVEGAFVTAALLNGRQPSLVDAMVAVRFMGCSSAVVAVLGASGAAADESLPIADGNFPVTIVACHRDPAAVADAYLRELLAEPAACA